MTRRGALVRAAQAGGVALVAYVGYGIYAAGLQERPPPPSSTSISFMKGTAAGHRVVSRSWSADYERIESNADQTVLELEGVRHGVIYKKGKPYLNVVAKHVSVNTVSRDFSATGPLHVETIGASPHRSFDTTSAVWDDGLQRLTLASHIIINTGGEAPLSVGSMIFNVKTGQIEIDAVNGPIRFK